MLENLKVNLTYFYQRQIVKRVILLSQFRLQLEIALIEIPIHVAITMFIDRPSPRLK